MTQSRKWKRNPQVAARRIGDETILVPTGRGIVDHKCLFTLNETGSFLWELLAEPRSFGDMAARAEFDVTAEQAGADLARFLDDLAGAGCILEAGSRD
jgi:hypothetical protein